MEQWYQNREHQRKLIGYLRRFCAAYYGVIAPTYLYTCAVVSHFLH